MREDLVVKTPKEKINPSLIRKQERNKMKKLNIGCGNDYQKDYINCDICPGVNPDVIMDFTKAFPFEDNSIDEIIMNHVLEHSERPIDVLREIYRVCTNKALIRIKVPFFSSESAFSMLDHYSFFSWTTFDCLDENHINHWQGIGSFNTINKKLHWIKILYPLELLFGLFPRFYQEFFCWWFPAKELDITLEVVK